MEYLCLEMFEMIIGYLDYTSLINFSLTNKSMQGKVIHSRIFSQYNGKGIFNIDWLGNKKCIGNALISITTIGDFIRICNSNLVKGSLVFNIDQELKDIVSDPMVNVVSKLSEKSVNSTISTISFHNDRLCFCLLICGSLFVFDGNKNAIRLSGITEIFSQYNFYFGIKIPSVNLFFSGNKSLFLYIIVLALEKENPYISSSYLKKKIKNGDIFIANFIRYFQIKTKDLNNISELVTYTKSDYEWNIGLIKKIEKIVKYLSNIKCSINYEKFYITIDDHRITAQNGKNLSHEFIKKDKDLMYYINKFIAKNMGLLWDGLKIVEVKELGIDIGKLRNSRDKSANKPNVYNVKQLRSFCSKFGIKHSRLIKAEMVDKLMEFIN